MNDNQRNNVKEAELKKLKEKPLPDNIRKSVDQKLKQINKPLNK